MSLPSRLLGANPSIQVSTLLSGSLSTPSAKGARVAEFGDYTTTWEHIATTVVANSTTAQVTFSSIPGTYSALQLRMTLGNESTQSGYYIRFNSDTSTAYFATRANNTDITTSPYFQTFTDTSTIDDGSPPSPRYAPYVVEIPGYADSSNYKSALSQSGTIYSTTGRLMNTSAVTWKSTAAITSITIRHSSLTNYLLASSYLSLYGMA